MIVLHVLLLLTIAIAGGCTGFAAAILCVAASARRAAPRPAPDDAAA